MKQAVNSILTYLDKLPPEDRVRSAAQVQDMVESAGWQVFADFVDKALAETRELVEWGSHEHVEYAAMHGRIRGLRYSLSIPVAVIESGARADKELRQIAAREDSK